MKIRIGHGFDVHRFDTDPQPAAEIRLGGVAIPSEQRLLAHSDGDVLIHALCDALLGAAGLGDIGEHFPDTDDRYKGADSCDLLRNVLAQLAQTGWQVGNVDITLIAQTPRVSPYKDKIRATLSAELGCQLSDINVKATTTEGLGYTGRKEGVACHAVALICSQS